MSEERNPADDVGEELSLEIEQEDDGHQTPVADDGGDADIESGDEGGPQEHEDQAPQQGLDERRRPSRVRPSAREEITHLRSERRELQQRIDNLERQFNQSRQPTADELRAQEAAEEQRFFAELQQQVIDPVQQAARISQFYNQRTERRAEARFQQIQYSSWNQTDQANYERILSERPEYERLVPRVEEMVRQYPGVGRVDLLKHAIGDEVMRRAPTQRRRQANGAAMANGSQRTQPSRPAGNVPGERRQGQRRGFEHMRNVPI